MIASMTLDHDAYSLDATALRQMTEQFKGANHDAPSHRDALDCVGARAAPRGSGEPARMDVYRRRPRMPRVP